MTSPDVTCSSKIGKSENRYSYIIKTKKEKNYKQTRLPRKFPKIQLTYVNKYKNKTEEKFRSPHVRIAIFKFDSLPPSGKDCRLRKLVVKSKICT